MQFKDLFFFVWLAVAACRPSLEQAERAVEKRFDVPQLSRSALRGWLEADSSHFALFDVRTATEYEVGHIPTAVRVDPAMAAEAFIEAHGPRLAGRQVVFYCSVGYRSSLLAERVQAAALAAGATKTFNLRGGVFGWDNDGFPVVSEGDTAYVHPYDAFWGRLLKKNP